MNVLKNDINFENIGFGYTETEYRFVSNYKNEMWDNGELTTDSRVILNESACVLQYAQTCFEGLKAYRLKNGNIACFRPDMNAKRMEESCKRLEMPIFPEEKFIDAVIKTVKANEQFIPPYSSNASLYLRPYMIGTSSILGVKPSKEYQFRIFASPVGAYFNKEKKQTILRISDFDRAAPKGTGHVKAGLNYAMSLYPIAEAHRKGFSENIYLDSATRTKIEETGGANIIFIENNKLITPKSSTILPSITKNSLLYIAKNHLNLEVEEREIYLNELDNFSECALCGTAAVLTPVHKIVNKSKIYEFDYREEYFGKISKKLYETLRAIQKGELIAPEGWIKIL